MIASGDNWKRPGRRSPLGNFGEGGTDYYYNESWQCLEERFAANQESKETVATAAKVQWLWDIRYIDAPVLRWRDDNDDGDFTDSGETLYYANDVNMTVTALLDASDGWSGTRTNRTPAHHLRL